MEKPKKLLEEGSTPLPPEPTSHDKTPESLAISRLAGPLGSPAGSC
jgi:hypothetical protein